MAAPPPFGTEDYAQALARLSPRGIIWRTDSWSTFMATLRALAPTYTRATSAAAQVLVDARPDTTDNLLPEWEASLGLPDPCTPLNASLEQRRAAVRAKFGARGALSPAYFIQLAAALGFTITITEFRPFSADMPCDLPDYGPEFAFIWQINIFGVAILYFTADNSGADDPLESDDAAELMCRLSRDAPAETTLQFEFLGPEVLYWDSGETWDSGLVWG